MLDIQSFIYRAVSPVVQVHENRGPAKDGAQPCQEDTKKIGPSRKALK